MVRWFFYICVLRQAQPTGTYAPVVHERGRRQPESKAVSDDLMSVKLVKGEGIYFLNVIVVSGF